MGKGNITHWAETLHQARVTAHPVEQISKTTPFSRSDAYAIQEAQFALRLAAGEKQVGWKMGLTSEAKRRQMNLDSPLYGALTDRMQVHGTFSCQGTIHPKIEPEIAFHIARDLRGSVSREEVLGACSGVAACMEILDSRYTQFKYFSMEDVIADNSSSSHFVLGPWAIDFQALDLTALPMRMSADGQVVQSGVSSDISGDPVVSVQQLCQLLAERDQILKAGSIVLAGAATPAVELRPGMHVALEIPGLPRVEVVAEA